MLPPPPGSGWRDSDTAVTTVRVINRVDADDRPYRRAMSTRSTRIRTGIVTGLAVVSLSLTGCIDAGSGEDGGGNQQEEGDNGGEEDD